MGFARTVRDRATSSAKRLSHAEVAERHVALAIAELLRERDKAVDDAVLDGLRSLVGGPGSSIATPTLTAEAEAMCSRCTSPDAGAEVLQAFVTEHVADVPGATLLAQATGSGSSAAAGADVATTAAETADPEQVLADAMADLDRLVGLGSVKEQVRKLTAVQQLNRVRKDEGLAPLSAGMHLVFTGEPGTGKTSVARIVARIYQGLGLLPRGHLVEASRADLVAGYVGQTAIRVKETMQRARGGVLFIDEAYALAGQGEQDFGAEAVATLVKEMEDHRGTTAVIVAGYAEEMQHFVGSNPGLRSRFQTFISFPSYEPDELLEIFERLAKDNQVEYGPDVRDAVHHTIRQSRTDGDAGNARFVRALFEEMTTRMAVRAAEDGRVELHEVLEFSLGDVPEAEVAQRPGIGFRP